MPESRICRITNGCTEAAGRAVHEINVVRRGSVNGGVRLLDIVNLPQAYIDYMRAGNCIEAFLNCEFPSYMQLWPLDSVDQYNQEYNVPQFASGFICFGSNGGGELLAFDQQGAVYCLPAIGMAADDATRVAESWDDFARHIETAT